MLFRSLINKEYLNFESIVEEIEKKRIESERLNRELLIAQEKSQKIEKLLKEKEDKINDEREKIIQAAKKEAEELIEKTKKYVEDLRKEASGIKTNSDSHASAPKHAIPACPVPDPKIDTYVIGHVKDVVALILRGGHGKARVEQIGRAHV